MSAIAWVGIGLGGWTMLSVPAALLVGAVLRGHYRGLPVIAEADRRPVPPHLRRPALLR